MLNSSMSWSTRRRWTCARVASYPPAAPQPFWPQLRRHRWTASVTPCTPATLALLLSTARRIAASGSGKRARCCASPRTQRCGSSSWITSTPTSRMASNSCRRTGTSASPNGRQRDDEHARAPTREPGGQPLLTDTSLQFLEGMKLPTLSLPRTSVTDQGPARLRALRCRRMLDPNNKIKTMQRKAYGFRDKEFFKLKILAGHEAKYALVG